MTNLYAIYRPDSSRCLHDYGNKPGAIVWSAPAAALNFDWASAMAVAQILRATGTQCEIAPVEEESPFTDLAQYHAPDGFGWEFD